MEILSQQKRTHCFLHCWYWRFTEIGLLALALGCNQPEETPKYQIVRAPSLILRWDDPGRIETNFVSTTYVIGATTNTVENEICWKDQLLGALQKLRPWNPDPIFLSRMYTNACLDWGYEPTDPEMTNLETRVADFFYGQGGFFKISVDQNFNVRENAQKHLQHKVRAMLVRADREHAKLFITNYRELNYAFIANQSGCLPAMASCFDPVGVSVTPNWDSTSKGVSPYDRSKSGLDKIFVLREESPTNVQTTTVGGGNAVLGIEDFNPFQEVTLSISTVLNSPSVLDRIEYASTYIYIYPWQAFPNGDAVLEKEFWMNLISVYYPRKSEMKLDRSCLENDMQRSIESMGVHVEDIGTTVVFTPIELGSLQQTQTSSRTVEGGASAATPANMPSVSANFKSLDSANSVANMSLKQQLDQRSTYLDARGNFVRITQRGMQSANLAGRIKENLLIHVPKSRDPIKVLLPIGSELEAKGYFGQIKDNQIPLFRIGTLAQPIYSRVNALIFSVAVARQPSNLCRSQKDRFGLEDPRDANFIVGVTLPQAVTIWQWERSIMYIQTHDIFGKGIGPSKRIFFTSFDGEIPMPLRISGFTPAQEEKLYQEIRNRATNKNEVVSIPYAGRFLRIGLIDDEANPKELQPFDHIVNSRK